MTGAIDPSFINPVYSGASLSDDITNTNSNLFGTGNDPTSAPVQASNVTGAQGHVNISETATSTWDGLVSGLNQTPSTGNSLADVAQAAQTVAATATTALTTSATALNAVSAAPMFMALDPTQEANVPLTNLNATAAVVGTTTGNSMISFVRCQRASTKTGVTFSCKSGFPSNITSFYVNIYILDPSTGNLDYQFSSTNMAASVTNSAPWRTFSFPTGLPVNTGDVVAVEFQVLLSSSSGVMSFLGCSTPANPSNSSVLLQNLSASRSSIGGSPPTGNVSSFGWSAVGLPYVALESVAHLNQYFAPVTHQYIANTTVTPPSWANWVDCIALGGGGGGGGGTAGGGSSGGNTVITAGTNVVTGTGGAGAASGNDTSTQSYGGAPGPETYLTATYYGGNQVSYQSAGGNPGGGGGGGKVGGLYGYGGSPGTWAANTFALSGISSITIAIGSGGAANASFGAAPGCRGAAWLVFRQS